MRTASRVPCKTCQARLHVVRCAARSGRLEYGPPPPPVPDIDEDDERGAYETADDGKPLWLKDLERDIEHDPEVAELLKDYDGNEEALRSKMAEYCDRAEGALMTPKLGHDEPMRVVFREYDPCAVYFFMEFYSRPSGKQLELLDQVVTSWFLLGRLGGYNAMNLQVYNATDMDATHMNYRQDQDDEVFVSYYHEISELETQGHWARFRADLGTGDELGLDILINTLQGFSKEYVGLKQLCIGGQNEDWPIPEADMPEVTASPMQVFRSSPENEWGNDGDFDDDFLNDDEDLEAAHEMLMEEMRSERAEILKKNKFTSKRKASDEPTRLA